nr:ATP synthase F0 subunit 8 [Ergasilus anchoratus]UUB71177.1 ATP synthase F0 subunit 8 [Ergasilus anchoratus]
MPQMSPMNWLMLLFYFLIMFFVTFVKLYYE